MAIRIGPYRDLLTELKSRVLTWLRVESAHFLDYLDFFAACPALSRPFSIGYGLTVGI